MALPLVRVEGTEYQQGCRHGDVLRTRVRHNVEVYFDRFARETGLSREDVMQRAERYAEVLGEQSPAYLEGLRGVAAGSECGLIEIVAINVRYELLYSQYTQQRLGSASGLECTSYAALPEATVSGHLFVGQNWDWIPQVEGAVIHTAGGDEPDVLAYTEAGIFGGKLGLNSEGLGLAVNGLLSTDDDWGRLRKPFHVRCREILQCRTLGQAVRVVADEPRSCAANFLVARAGESALDLEAAPNALYQVLPHDGLLTHANHFVAPGEINVTEPPSEKRKYSYRREAHLRALMEAARPLTPERIQECLRDHQDHPNGLCRHPDPQLTPPEQSITVASTVIDLHARRLWVTERQPCENPYELFRL
jgi:isopenicillin-N N-acyltransferase like protein